MTDVCYVDSGTDDGSVVAKSETTVESTHPGLFFKVFILFILNISQMAR